MVEASKSEEHKQTLDGLQTAGESMCTLYERLQMDLKELDSNVLQLTKKLDDANTVQKIIVEALEATANQEKKLALEETNSYRLEAEGLRESLEASEKGRKKVEAELA
ncbi:hypothetical protein Adt_15535 [Abeliophyllum distichum]|uniref:Uncharacterized protein n=1 Tax=Abeliophyllum distichum TaxID=126358 RepID=A0ABD1U3N3_9LAMI